MATRVSAIPPIFFAFLVTFLAGRYWGIIYMVWPVTGRVCVRKSSRVDAIAVILLIVLIVLVTTIVTLCFFKGGTRGGRSRRRTRVRTGGRAISVLIVSGGQVPLGSSKLPRVIVSRAPGLVHQSGLPVMGTGINPGVGVLVTSRGIFSLVPIGGRVGTRIDNLCVINMGKVHNSLRTPRGGGGNFLTEFHG